MSAIIQTNGKQYRVEEGKRFRIDMPISEGAPAEQTGKEIVFDSVLFYEKGTDVRIGNPYVSGVKVVGKVVDEGKSKKVRVFRYRRRKRTRINKGHRQPYTEIEVTSIQVK